MQALRNVAFTIVAKNYIGLAMILQKSVKTHSPHTDFYIFVADELTGPEKNGITLPPNVLFAKDTVRIKNGLWNEMAFKYNLVEFCTAIKPACFNYLLDQHDVDKVIYLDPDIYVFNSFDGIFAELDSCSIYVTPHIINIHVPYNSDHPDYLFLVNGIFNLGFLAVRNTAVARQMIDWWQDRLYHQCFFDNDKGMATDQKWMNMLPAFFSGNVLKISYNAGLNAAPWNYFERRIVVKENSLYVTNRSVDNNEDSTPLVFVHFSGYDYKSFSNNVIIHKNESFVHYPDLKPVFDLYAAALKDDCFKQYIQLPYSYNYFKNGKLIISLNRRIFRRSIEEEGNIYADPFDTGNNSFYSKLKKSRLIDHSQVSADSVNNKNISGFNKKIQFVNAIFRLLQRVIGIRRYSILARFFKRYFKEENQYFLYDKKSKKQFY